MAVPLVFHRFVLFPHSSSKAYVLMALIEILAVGTLWLMWRQPSVRPRVTWTSIALTVFVGVLLLASVFGVDPSFSFWASIDRITGGLMWVHLLVFFWTVTTLIGTKEQWRGVLMASVAVGLVLSAIHGLFLIDIEVIQSQSGGSMFGNSSFFGTYLLFQIGFAGYLVASGVGRVRWMSLMSLVLLSATLLSTTANAAKISLIGGFVLWLALTCIFSKRGKFYRFSGWTLFVMLLLGFSFTVFSAFQEGSIVYSWFTDMATGSRFAVWKIAWTAIVERPWLGWGLENFQFVSLQYYNPCLGSELCGGELWFDRAHNKVLDLLVEAGVVGLVSYISILFFALKGLVKKHTTEFVMVASILAAYIVQNLTILDMSSGLFLFVLTIAFASSLSDKHVSVRVFSKKMPVLIPVLISVIFVYTFTVSVIHPVQGNYAVAQTAFAVTADVRLAAYERASTLSEVGLDFRRVYLANKTAQFVWSLSPESITPENNISIRAELALMEDGLRKTLEASPNYLRASLELARTLQGASYVFDSQMLDRAQVILEQALEINPEHPMVHWSLASIYIDQGMIDEAVELTARVVELSPGMERSHLFHMIPLLFQGDMEALEEVGRAAVALDPDLQADVFALMNADPERHRKSLLSLLY